jgi:Leucine-rich repeat (LRR) protein
MGEAPTLSLDALKLLLPLDEADVTAIRSFLPGRIFGRMAVLSALVASVFVFAGQVDVRLEKFLGASLEPPWLKPTLLFGAVFIVGAQILAELHAERKRRKAQAQVVNPGAVPEGYFRIGAYLNTPEDRAKFKRADKIHEKVLDWIRGSDAMPLYLTGDSGSGKSSVLNAYVLPALRDLGWTVVEARVWQDPERALSEAITKIIGEQKLGEPANMRGLLEVLAHRANSELLLVLDQFEEFLTLPDSERQEAFAVLIDDLRVRPIKGLRLLLVLRGDYKTRIEELNLPLLSLGENWREVGLFSVRDGMQFMKQSELGLQPDKLAELITGVSNLDGIKNMIRLITLNVVGHVLAQGGSTASSFDAAHLVRHYIEQSVEQPTIRGFAPRVLKELVTEQGTKRPRSEKDLVAQTALQRAEVRLVMLRLWAAGLARPLDAAQDVWELSHDFVARAITRYLEERRLDWAGLPRGYAASALFGLLAVVAVGATAWSLHALDRVRSELAELGINVSSDGLEANTSGRFNIANWTEAGSLVAKLTALQSLDLTGAPVADLGPLKGLTTLRALTLWNTQVADLEPLNGLTALQTLSLWNTRVTDVAPLKSLTGLNFLTLANTQVADLSPLKELTKLEWLYLTDTQVADLGPLKGLTALRLLDLANTQVARLEPLKRLTALQSLALLGTPIRDLEPLKGLTALQTLDLRYTQIADLVPVQDLPNLRTVRGTSETALQTLNAYRSQKRLPVIEPQ